MHRSSTVGVSLQNGVRCAVHAALLWGGMLSTTTTAASR